MDEFERSAWLERVEALRQTIRALRAGRRVLMNLLVSAEEQRRARIGRLEGENERLRRMNRRLARALLERDARIRRLEAELRRAQAEATRGSARLG